MKLFVHICLNILVYAYPFMCICVKIKQCKDCFIMPIKLLWILNSVFIAAHFFSLYDFGKDSDLTELNSSAILVSMCTSTKLFFAVHQTLMLMALSRESCCSTYEYQQGAIILQNKQRTSFQNYRNCVMTHFTTRAQFNSRISISS